MEPADDATREHYEAVVASKKPIDQERFDRLTEKQRECLRLAGQHLTSKQIARLLGKSKMAVDQLLDRARHTLGCADRAEAVRVFAKLEGAYDRITYDPQTIAERDSSPSHGPIGSSAESVRHVMQEEQYPYLAPHTGRSRWAIPGTGGGQNDLTIRQRLAWIAIMALGIVLVSAALVAVAFGAVRMISGLASIF